MTDKTRRVSIPAVLFDRLEKVANDRLVGANLIVAKAVEKYLGELEQQSQLP